MSESPKNIDPPSEGKPSPWENYLTARLDLLKLEWAECQQQLILKVVGVVLILVSMIALLFWYFGAVSDVMGWFSVGLMRWIKESSSCGCLNGQAYFDLSQVLASVLTFLWHVLVAVIALKAMVLKESKFFGLSIEELHTDLEWLKSRLPKF